MEARAKFIADLAAQYCLTRLVEVGVHRGWFSRWLLESNPAIYLIGVDPYAPYAENTTDRRGDRAEAQANYRVFPDRCELLLMTSLEASRQVKNPELVYIDGAHDTPSVSLDCESWYPLLRPGCILSGHDYNHPPVAAAVDAFAARRGLKVHTYSAIESEGITRTNWYMFACP